MRKRGFTLIELLIVVAIIAILAAIAVPNFLEAQIRSKVSRAQTDMRSLATAIEAYMVDANRYPASYQGQSVATVNWGLRPSKARERLTFGVNSGGTLMFTLTTPTPYITTIPTDPFANTRGSVFGYANAAELGWIIWSYGPDNDENDQGDLDPMSTTSAAGKKLDGNPNGQWSANSIYNPRISNPTLALLTGPTYDPTNGSTSDGDVWRVRQ